MYVYFDVSLFKYLLHKTREGCARNLPHRACEDPRSGHINSRHINSNTRAAKHMAKERSGHDQLAGASSVALWSII